MAQIKAILTEQNKSDGTSTPYQTHINFSTSWQGSDPYTQEVTVKNATENSRVDLHPDASMLAQLAEDKVSALYVENRNGTFTANATGGPPSTSMRMLATVTEVTPEPTAPDYLVNPTIGQEITWCGDTWIIVHFNDTQVFICKKTAYGTSNTVFNSSDWSESNLYACRYQGSNLASVAASYASTLSSSYPTDFSYAENYTIHGVSAKIWAPAQGMVCNDSAQPYNDLDGTNNYNQNNTNARGCGTIYYPIFSLFNSTGNTSDSRRICYDNSGSAVHWWTASAYNRSRVWLVTTDGRAGAYNSPTTAVLQFRPFACLTR